MELIKSINDAINGVVWGVPMLILIIGTGIYFSVRLGFFQVTKFGHVLSSTIFSSFKKSEKSTGKHIGNFLIFFNHFPTWVKKLTELAICNLFRLICKELFTQV